MAEYIMFLLNLNLSFVQIKGFNYYVFFYIYFRQNAYKRVPSDYEHDGGRVPGGAAVLRRRGQQKRDRWRRGCRGQLQTKISFFS